jgi:hypothetical protein
MNIVIINALVAIVRMLNNIIAALTANMTDVEFEAVDLEFEAVTDTRVVFTFAALDAVLAARQAQWTIDTSVEVEVQVEFDDAAILAALGLATAAPVVETVEVVVEVATPVETVIVNGVVYTITHLTNVDVIFTGRVNRSFSDVEGYLFEGTDGTSDFLLRVQAPLSLANAREWMSRSNETRAFNTRVVVTPTCKY